MLSTMTEWTGSIMTLALIGTAVLLGVTAMV